MRNVATVMGEPYVSMETKSRKRLKHYPRGKSATILIADGDSKARQSIPP